MARNTKHKNREMIQAPIDDQELDQLLVQIDGDDDEAPDNDEDAVRGVDEILGRRSLNEIDEEELEYDRDFDD